MAIVSQAEYARLRGVSKKTITQWKQERKLVLADGGVDVEASDAYLSRYRTNGLKGNDQGNAGNDQGNDPGNAEGKASGNDRPRALPAAYVGETPAQAAERIVASVGANMSIEEAKRVKENYLALLNQLEYDRESGLVVESAIVAQAVGEEYAKVRTRLLSIPAEQAPYLHRLKTVAEVQDALQQMITDALEELTKDGDC